MRKNINILMIAMLLVSAFMTPIVASGASLKDWTDQGYVKVGGDILPPEIVGSVDGVGIYFSNVDSFNYSIKKSDITVPNGSEIEELVLLKNNQEYKKLTYNSATNSYGATIEKNGNQVFKADGTPQTLLYQWWRASGDKTKWAFDLDGVRHWRKSTMGVTDSPPTNAVYYNEPTSATAFGQGTYVAEGQNSVPSSFYSTWPYPQHALRYNVFFDEVAGKGNVGWSYTTIPIEFSALQNQAYQYSIDIQKIKDRVKMQYHYSKPPKYQVGGIEEWDVSGITNEFSEPQAIMQGYMNVWYRINFSNYSYIEYLSGTNGERRIHYYGQWQMKYTAEVPFYEKYTLVAKFSKGTGLVDLTGGDFCLPDKTMQMSVKLYVPGTMNDDVTTKSYIKWKSSDESIATVAKGLVTAHKAGTVEITAIYSEGKSDESKISKTIEIKDCGDAELIVDSSSLNACPLINDTIQLNSTIKKRDGYVWNFLTTEPHAKLAYTSSNSTIATVTNTGLVKLKKQGDVVISVTYTEGDGSPPIVKEIAIKVNKDLTTCDTTYELDVNASLGSCPAVGDSIQINTTVKKRNGTDWETVTDTAGKLTYTSSKTSVASVSSTGLINLLATGEVTIKVTYATGDEPLVKEIKINVRATSNDCEPPPSSGSSSCSFIISAGGVGSTMNQSFLAGDSTTGAIESQTGEFDVVQGIPSSEYLKTHATMPKYLFEQNYEQQTGKVIYTIKVTKNYILEWEEAAPPSEDPDAEAAPPVKITENATKDVEIQVERNYTYWNVAQYNVWDVKSALEKNYALPNGESLMPNYDGVTANATKDTDVNNHVFPTDCPSINLDTETINGGSAKPEVPDFTDEAKGKAEAEIRPPNVKNDKAEFNGSTLMSDSMAMENGPTPLNIPYPSNITLKAENLQIDPLKTNYWHSLSSGLVTYDSVFSLNGSTADKNFNFAVNDVTVHTPVVIYSKSSDDKEHDQRTNAPVRSTPANSDVDRHAYVLDRPFTVTLPTKGMHRDIPGYRDRDYSKYIKQKQVKFPFDVYSETKAAFYPANTWITIPVDIESANFFLPVWVPESQYTVDFRAFAINALSSGDFGGSEHEANITIPNTQFNVAPAGTQSAAHVAYDSIEVDVVGRLYDFHVTDVTDFNWQNTFREIDGVTPNGNSYWVGSKGIDGDSRGLDSKFTLPLRQGSTKEGYSNVAVKTGYKFRFDMKTKGNMMDGNDAIRIKPTFYFVKKDGTNRQEIDLYYKEGTSQFVQVGSSQDTVNREVVLNESLRNVPKEDLLSNADYYFRHKEQFDGMEELALNKFSTTFNRNYLKIHSKENVVTGPYGWQLLNWKLRTYIGPQENEVPTNAMVPVEDAVSTEQTWYSEYSIPASVYAVPKGTNIATVGLNANLSDNSAIFLRDGYIIVNFDIETIDNGDLNNPRLQYINAPMMNQWFDMEGFSRSFVDPYGNAFNSLDGDVIYYHAESNNGGDDGSSNGDFNNFVTH